ncbi:MAG: DUF4911 domain-containing protein [Desulfovibrio sp.]|nr:DUF4911 domain-containing protein [Desulfovibrio sp.]
MCYIRLAPQDIGLFRFLLEAYENVGYFTVVDRVCGWLKISTTPSMEETMRRVLAEIAHTVVIEAVFWPKKRAYAF